LWIRVSCLTTGGIVAILDDFEAILNENPFDKMQQNIKTDLFSPPNVAHLGEVGGGDRSSLGERTS
jgi:hypothetical protein